MDGRPKDYCDEQIRRDEWIRAVRPRFSSALAGKVQPQKLITHRFALADIMEAYATFGNAMQERALKVIITSE